MDISRNKIRDMAWEARDNDRTVTFDGYILKFHLSSVDSAGRKKGTFELTGVDGGSFMVTSIGKLVEHIQALPEPDAEMVIVDDASDCSDVDVDRDEDRLKSMRSFIDEVNASVTNHPPPTNGKSFTNQKSFRRLRSHRRKLRRSGTNKGLSVLG